MADLFTELAKEIVSKRALVAQMEWHRNQLTARLTALIENIVQQEMEIASIEKIVREHRQRWEKPKSFFERLLHK